MTHYRPIDTRPKCRERECDVPVDRIPYNACGGSRNGGIDGCGGYFCDRHLHQQIGGEVHLCSMCID